jgi:hypothetical protein
MSNLKPLKDNLYGGATVELVADVRKIAKIRRCWLATMAGHVMDPIQASNWFEDDCGIRFDWHDFSDDLEYLVHQGQAERTGVGSDRMTNYLILGEVDND